MMKTFLIQYLSLLVVSAMFAYAAPPVTTLEQARMEFRTTIAFVGDKSAAPLPPRDLFEKVLYPSSVGQLAAYITPKPRNRVRHPAIIWITGGDCNSIGDVWSPSSELNDQTAHAYRDAGIVMMYPSLRGGNDNPGRHEGFYGEVNDVLAAFAYLAKQPYVDPSRIYLGGHSTGGTLALLTAEYQNPFRAVFAFGPVAIVTSYGHDILPVNFDTLPKSELRLRSPGLWLGSAKGAVYAIEGTESPSNIQSLDVMRKYGSNSAVRFLTVAHASHFSVLASSNRIIANKILLDTSDRTEFDLQESELQLR